jgi:hypothetical protein
MTIWFPNGKESTMKAPATIKQASAMRQHGELMSACTLPSAGFGAARLTKIQTTSGSLTVYGVYDAAALGLRVSVSEDGRRVHVGGLGNRSFVRAPCDQ